MSTNSIASFEGRATQFPEKMATGSQSKQFANQVDSNQAIAKLEIAASEGPDAVLDVVLELFGALMENNADLKLQFQGLYENLKEELTKTQQKARDETQNALEKQSESRRGKIMKAIGGAVALALSAVAFVVAPSPITAALLVVSTALFIDSMVVELTDREGMMGQLTTAVSDLLEKTDLSGPAKMALVAAVTVAVIVVAVVATKGAASTSVGKGLMQSMDDAIANGATAISTNRATISMVASWLAFTGELVASAGEIDVSVVNYKVEEFLKDGAKLQNLADFMEQSIADSQLGSQEIDQLMRQIQGVFGSFANA